MAKKKTAGRKRTLHTPSRKRIKSRYEYALKRRPCRKAYKDILAYINSLEKRGLGHALRRQAHGRAVREAEKMKAILDYTTCINFLNLKVKYIMVGKKKVASKTTAKKMKKSKEDPKAPKVDKEVEEVAKLVSTIGKKLLEGETVEGFTLVPLAKAEANPTVEVIAEMVKDGKALCKYV